jgi:superfamily I DNA/RNA helicase
MKDTEKKPSKYQIEIFNKYKNTDNNIIIKAGPGTGKSHTILELLKITPKYYKSILVAFNKSIKDELEQKVPDHIKVSTIHSLSFSILRKNVSRNFKVNSYKNFILGKKVLNLSHLKAKDIDPYLFTISRIVDLSRMNLCNSRKEIEQLCDLYNISTINGEIDNTLELIDYLDKYNKKDHKEFMIDFTDMLYLANTMVKRRDFPLFNRVFCDELQDLNLLQKEIVEKIISPANGRFIGVGDERQSIYSFMGSNQKAFNSFIERPNTIVLPLSVTYRCGVDIVKKANEVFDGLEPFELNPQGIVRSGKLEEVQEGDFVICRNNLPLVEAWIDIIKQGKTAHILGKDFGQNLLTINSKLSKYDDYNKGVEDLLNKKEEELKQKEVRNPKRHPSYQSLVEKLNIIEILRKEFRSFEVMSQKISEIFNDNDSEGVRLMTGHKSKGLESDRVFFLKPELIPSKYADTELELHQERCLMYVIITRAKKELIYI